MDSHGHTHPHPNPPELAPIPATGDGPRSPATRNLIIGAVVAIALSYLLSVDAKDGLSHFLHSYVVSYAFFLSLSLGALFFVAIQHITGSEWSVTVRRLAEIISRAFPVLAILFLPILASVWSGDGALFIWATKNKDTLAAWSASYGLPPGDLTGLLEKKVAYLSPGSFTVRWVLYFAIWQYLSSYFFSRSVKQDTTGDPELTFQCERLAPPAILLFALTLTFAAFDLLMSLDPTWFSTIFGVYYFAGSWMAFYAAISLAAMFLQRSGKIGGEITAEHYQDLGKFMFAFIFFWGYIAFSQYMLIWYANMPEETHWYLVRQRGGWLTVSWMLVFGHFVFPFMGTLSRHVKRYKPGLAFFALWLLAMHYMDLYWIVMPTVGTPEGQAGISIVDLAIFAAIGSVVAAALTRVASGVSLVPKRDPRLKAALAFHNI